MAPQIRQRPLARTVLRSQSDDRLVKLTRQGRELAFEEIVRRYRPGLVAFAHAYAPSDRAEDVVQESLLSSWDALRDSSSEVRLKPWLYRIVRNRALNARRDAKVHQELDETIDGVRQPGEIALANEELEGVVSAVRALPDSQREALVRSSLDGHTHAQIAEAIGTSPGGVRQLVFRARSSLRAGLGAVVPLPLVALLSSGGAAGAAGGVAAGTAASAGGGSLATTGATVAAVAAIAIGGGVAIERWIEGEGREAAKAAAENAGSGGAANSDIRGPGAPADGPPSEAQRPSGSGDEGEGSSGSSNETGSSDSGGSSAGSGDADQQSEQAEESREAVQEDAEEARDDARDAAEAAEAAEEEAEEAAEEAAEAQEEAAEAEAAAAAAEADLSETSGSSGSSGSGSSGSGSDSSGSGSDSTRSGSSDSEPLVEPDAEPVEP